MAEPESVGPLAEGYRVEVVRGAIGPELGDALISFWTAHGVLSPEGARERLAEVVCVLRDPGGEIAAVNSVYAARNPTVGGKCFWQYRSFSPEPVPGARDAMLTEARQALADEYRESKPTELEARGAWVAERFLAEPGSAAAQPIGLCVVVDDPTGGAHRPEAVWPGSKMLLAGFDSRGRQIRISYFDNLEDAPPEGWQYPLEAEYSIEPLAEAAGIDEQTVIDFWVAGEAMPAEVAERRVGEVDMVGIAPDGSLAGLTTTYLAHSERLRREMWYLRSFVGPEHRRGRLMSHLALRSRAGLIERFVDGADRRAPGLMVEIEAHEIEHRFPWPVFPISELTFIGVARRGAHLRVLWFPGAELAPPAAAPGSRARAG